MNYCFVLCWVALSVILHIVKKQKNKTQAHNRIAVKLIMAFTFEEIVLKKKNQKAVKGMKAAALSALM